MDGDPNYQASRCCFCTANDFTMLIAFVQMNISGILMWSATVMSVFTIFLGVDPIMKEMEWLFQGNVVARNVTKDYFLLLVVLAGFVMVPMLVTSVQLILAARKKSPEEMKPWRLWAMAYLVLIAVIGGVGGTLPLIWDSQPINIIYILCAVASVLESLCIWIVSCSIEQLSLRQRMERLRLDLLYSPVIPLERIC